MKQSFRPECPALTAVLFGAILLFCSCQPSIKLTASWTERNIQPAQPFKILVVAFGKDLAKRRLGEEHIMAELRRRGFTAETSLGAFGPAFAGMDSIKMQQQLQGSEFDAVITIRVLNIHEQDRWYPGDAYYANGPVGFYRGFYGYFYRVWGYYSDQGYTVTDVEVLLESNLYLVASGKLLWSGQSKAFNRNPTDVMAAKYARNIVEDMLRKHALALPVNDRSTGVSSGS